MVETGPGRSSEEIKKAIRSALRHQEKNFNALYRELKQKGILGSPNTLVKHLRLLDKEVYVREESGPGIDRKYYGLIEDLPEKYGIEASYGVADNLLKEFWLRNPNLAPIEITMAGTVRIHEGEPTPEQLENELPKLHRHLKPLAEMTEKFLKQMVRGEYTMELVKQVKELNDAHMKVWEIAVDAQIQEWSAAEKEGREPDYLDAVIKLLGVKQPLKGRIEQTRR